MALTRELCGFCKVATARPCQSSEESARCGWLPKVAKVETQADVDAITAKARGEGGTLGTQVGGNHYTRMAIQPIEYIEANGIAFIEGNVIKYVSRWEHKGGVEDLKKARDMLTKKIEFVEKRNAKGK